IGTEEAQGDRHHEHEDLHHPVGAEPSEEEAGHQTEDRAEKLDDHKGGRIHVPRVSGEHELALLLLEIADRSESLQEGRDFEDRGTDCSLRQRLGELLVTGRLHSLTTAIEGQALGHVLTSSCDSEARPHRDEQDQGENGEDDQGGSAGKYLVHISMSTIFLSQKMPPAISSRPTPMAM